MIELLFIKSGFGIFRYFFFLPRESGNDVTLCNGAAITLVPVVNNNFTSYSWSTGENVASSSVNYPGTFILEATNGSGCKAYDTVSVLQDGFYPVFYFTDPQYICPGLVVVLETPYPLIQHRWQDHCDLPQFSAWQPGLYWVRVTSHCGGAYTDSVTVLAGAYPRVNRGEDTIACLFIPFNLIAPVAEGNEYLWNDGLVSSFHPVTGYGN